MPREAGTTIAIAATVIRPGRSGGPVEASKPGKTTFWIILSIVGKIKKVGGMHYTGARFRTLGHRGLVLQKRLGKEMSETYRNMSVSSCQHVPFSE